MNETLKKIMRNSKDVFNSKIKFVYVWIKMKKFFDSNRNDYVLRERINIYVFQCTNNASSVIRNYGRSLVKTVECKT